MIKSKTKVDLTIFLLLIFLPLFFYKLGQSSLASFDEAWYADISRNVLINRELFKTYWNGKIFFDHPPAGFWLTALAYKVFGVTNFSARFTQAISGFLGLIFTYLLGKKLFNKYVGLASAMVLASSNWYLFRARSGNLDTLLTLLFVSTIYLAVLAAENKKYTWPLAGSLALLLLTKSVAPFTVFPTLAVVLWKKVKAKDLLFPSILAIGVFGYWFFVQSGQSSTFLSRFLSIGLPGVETKTDYIQNLILMKTYLHNGVGSIFWWGIAGIIGGALTIQKRFWILAVFTGSFFAPFMLSSRGHIWHLIPLHPVLALAFFGYFYLVLEKTIKDKLFCTLLVLATGIHLAYPQIQKNWHEFINVAPFISDEEILSRKAGEYDGDLFVDGDFVPAAVFYSGKVVTQYHQRVGNLESIMQENPGMLLITKQKTLEDSQILPNSYEVILKDRDRVLVRGNNLFD